MLHVRVDDETKEQATAALEAMGLSVSEAIRVFLRRVAVEQAMPFALKVPKTKLTA
jgi:DNA-damage-inducible protein J